MGRKHRRRVADEDVQRDLSTVTTRRVEDFGGEDWVVQAITGSAATKVYRCPGCDHEIRPATPHVVAWPLDEREGHGLAARRHWHTACWARRHHRDRRVGPR